MPDLARRLNESSVTLVQEADRPRPTVVGPLPPGVSIEGRDVAYDCDTGDTAFYDRRLGSWLRTG